MTGDQWIGVGILAIPLLAFIWVIFRKPADDWDVNRREGVGETVGFNGDVH